MRRHLPLALLPFLACACSSPTRHVTEASYSSQVSTSEIALGLLDAGAFECRIDGEAVEAGEAARRIRDLPRGESIRLALEQDDAVVELDVTGDSTIAASSRWSWTSEVPSRWGWK